MNVRCMMLLREFMAADTPLTSRYLSHRNEVTARTTRNDIKQLNDALAGHGAVIHALHARGYELRIDDDDRFRHYLEQIFQRKEAAGSMIPDEPEERVYYLMKRLLLAGDYVKLDDMADELLISRSTIQNDIRIVRDILQTYDITLENRPNYGLKVSGSEMKLRFCISEYVFDRSIKHEASRFHNRLPWLMNDNMNDIWDIIVEEINEHDITLSDIALNNLFIHTAITCKRVQTGHHISFYAKEFDEIMDQKEYEVAETIVKKVEQALGVTFPEVEIAYIAMHLLGTKMISETNMTEERIEAVMDERAYSLTSVILEEVEQKLDLGIRHDRELQIGLSLHLKPAVNRYRYGMNIRNPLLDDIKTNYPASFEAAVIAGMVLEKEEKVSIEESEIGYIALHFGAAMERQNLEKRPKRCMIVCASGAGSAQLIYYKLQARFGTQLELAGTTEYYNLPRIPLQELDFLISTMEIPDDIPIPVIHVNTILGEGDLKKVENAVSEDQWRNMSGYVKEELIFLQQDMSSKEEVLHFLGGQLMEKGYTDGDFLEKLYEREDAAPTSFGNMTAVPHPITPQTTTTFLAVCTLQKPIIWDDKRVQLVCLLSIEKNSRHDLQALYKSLGAVIDDLSLVQQLVQCSTKHEFLRLFLS
ncbi:BglG family transcription antiterminator [Salibacterium halotolerans]|uniref:Lichenan operon transcriptional antiterminator n=1 Tax=Salibacterium halotolerans TaxID=1884432 RepID=A0A1I5QV45_9BACI|nr:BglG family transcription antiterminator [Salibacterium halotolerans]SFP49726.1 lichenan operon transcriptional antiterminator [Salibacterium halotolerans]